MTKVEWLGDEVLKQLSKRLTKALNEIDKRIRVRARQELRRGHGKRTGKLQRSIRYVPAKRQGLRIVGAVGGRRFQGIFVHGGVPARMRRSRAGRSFRHKGQVAIPYLEIGFDHVKPQAGDIIAKEVTS